MPRRSSREAVMAPEAAGERLRLLRREAHLTQRALAEAAGIHPQTVAQVERGVLPLSAEVALKLAATLGCAPYLLLGTAWPGAAAEARPVLRLVRDARGSARPATPADAALLADLGGSAGILAPTDALLDLARHAGVAVRFDPG